MAKIREPTSKFIKVRCSKCKNEQIIFGKVSSKVECLICGSSGRPLAEPTGGKSRVKARILEVLE
jgi:small subunit ribosomal protein S27e